MTYVDFGNSGYKQTNDMCFEEKGEAPYVSKQRNVNLFLGHP